jgi:hypothetical protein
LVFCDEISALAHVEVSSHGQNVSSNGMSIRQEVMSAARQKWLAARLPRRTRLVEGTKEVQSLGGLSTSHHNSSSASILTFQSISLLNLSPSSIRMHICIDSINSSTPLGKCVSETTYDANGSLRTAFYHDSRKE